MIYKKIDGVPEFEATEYCPKKSRYCVCIPIINEGERIKKELERAKKHGIDKVCDIIICDGGSTDGSTQEETLRELGVNTLLVKKSEGKQGAQLRMGMWWALKRGYDGIITIDGNNKDSIEDIPKFIEKLKEGYDFVQGSRFIKGGKAVNTPLIRYVSVRAVHAPVISATAGEKFTDTTNAFRAYSKKYLKDPEVNPFRDIFVTYELLAYLSVRASQLGYKTCEIPVTREYPKNEKTPTKISFFKGNFDLMKILIKNYFGAYNPKHEKKKLETKEKIRRVSVFLVFMVTLFMGFFGNCFYAANMREFESWQTESEALVIGKMQYDRNISGDNTGGFLMCLDIKDDYELQKNSYINGEETKTEDYIIYDRQIGLQGKLFSALSNLSSSNEAALNLCYVINSLLSAAALSLLLYWFYRRFGMTAAVFGWIAALFSPWLAVAGRNLYWCIWTMLLPMLCVLLLLEIEEKQGREHNVFMFIITVLSFFVRSACGYEFISCIMVSAELPLVYFAVKNRMNLKKYVKRASVIGIAAVVGFLCAVAIHLSMSASYYGDFSSAWASLADNIVSRTGAFGSSDTDWMYVASLNSNANEVVNTYLYSGEGIVFGWHMGLLIPLFAVFAGLCFISEKYCKKIAENRRTLIALSVMTAVSVAGPASWFVLAKGHSWLHTHINYILWCLPAALLGFALVGAVLQCICSERFERLNKKKKCGFISAGVVLCLFFILFNNLHVIGNYNKISSLEKAEYSYQGVSIYYDNNIMYYVVDDSFDVNQTVYLRVVPTDVNDLIEGEREQGFNSLGFRFEEKEIDMPNFFGKRVAQVLVPNYYEPERIRTGQKNGEETLWDCSINIKNT